MYAKDFQYDKPWSIRYPKLYVIVFKINIGYGDITPTTLYGKLVGGACALSGVLMMALPVSVVASNFSLYNNYAKVSVNWSEHVRDFSHACCPEKRVSRSGQTRM